MYSIIIVKSLTRRLERNGPISDKQALHPWLTFHFDAVRLAVAVRNESADTLKRVLTKSTFCYGDSSQAV
ncbi:hypothetical protein T4E_11326 [Trichinella pseudospiralis]|nr:hypothetical protein T4E_11326 [Trichinella pseudospiralis]